MTTISGAREIYRKLSSQIESQFPEFIREEGPRFVGFLQAYFEYMEQSNKSVDAARGLFDTTDIDRTVDSFVEYFHREFLLNIPREVLVDKRLLTKHIREFYRSRGSQESFRFLFRILYNEEIDFYYPGGDVLRASDGRWVKETIIRGRPYAGTVEDMDGRAITGGTSGATARIQETLKISAAGLNLYQFTVENVVGTFQEDELITDGFGNYLKIFNAVGSITAAAPLNAGAKHQIGDTVTLSGQNGGAASGIITQTTDIDPITFRVKNGGSGYRVGNTTLTVTGGSPTYAARISIINISNTSTISINTNTINPLKNVVLNSVPFGAGGSMATKNVNSTITSSLTFNNATIGSINTIAVLDAGMYPGATLPTVQALDAEIYSQYVRDLERGGYKGNNAVIVASRTTGGIVSISITASDINFLKNDIINVTNVTRASAANTLTTSTDDYGGITRGTRMLGIYPATITGTIKGTFNLPGRYTDTKGMLSWNNKIQDNDYYQPFSYAIMSTKLLTDYAAIVKSMLHPAGTKLFGITQNNLGVDLRAYANVASTVVIFKKRYANNVYKSNTALKQFNLTVPPFWLTDGTLKANAGSIQVGGRGSNLFIVSVSNTSQANGLYQVNTIASSKRITLRQRYEGGGISNGYFYYESSRSGSV